MFCVFPFLQYSDIIRLNWSLNANANVHAHVASLATRAEQLNVQSGVTSVCVGVELCRTVCLL